MVVVGRSKLSELVKAVRSASMGRDIQREMSQKFRFSVSTFRNDFWVKISGQMYEDVTDNFLFRMSRCSLANPLSIANCVPLSMIPQVLGDREHVPKWHITVQHG